MYGFILENYDLRIRWGYRVVTCKKQNFAQQDSVECAEDSTTTLFKKERKVLNTKAAEET